MKYICCMWHPVGSSCWQSNSTKELGFFYWNFSISSQKCYATMNYYNQIFNIRLNEGWLTKNNYTLNIIPGWAIEVICSYDCSIQFLYTRIWMGTLQNPSPRKMSLKIEGVTKFKKIKLLHFQSYQCHNISWTIQDICSSYWLRVNWRMPVSELLIDWFCMLEDVKIVLLKRKWNSVGFRGLHYPSIDITNYDGNN